MTWFLVQLSKVSTLTFPAFPKANDQSLHLPGEIQTNVLIHMSVDPHKYSAGPGIFQCNSYSYCIPVRIFRGKILPERGCKKQHVSPCLYLSISNTTMEKDSSRATVTAHQHPSTGEAQRAPEFTPIISIH